VAACVCDLSLAEMASSYPAGDMVMLQLFFLISRFANKEGIFILFLFCFDYSEFLATDTEVPGSIPGSTRFF
jgi:hypothetical protein